MNLFLRLLESRSHLLADGATGTNLFALGLQSGDSPELWNVDYPDRIQRHYQSFIDAGSDLLLTNTFGGSRYRLKLHQAEQRVSELNEAGARLLKDSIAQSGRDIICAGSIGPTGEILEPNGSLSTKEAADAFAEQAIALQAGGADVLWIETLSSREEVHAAVEGASATDLPIIVTMSLDTNGRTMMGITANDMASMQTTLAKPLAALGTNCGQGASEALAGIVNLHNALQRENSSTPMIAKANCGIPQWQEGKIFYNGTPELMAEYTKMAMNSGVKIIGGCCGTTPEHIKTMRKAMDSHTAGIMPNAQTIESVLGEISSGAKAQLAGDLSVTGGARSGGRQSRSRRRSGN